jgi:hypothetical protein
MCVKGEMALAIGQKHLPFMGNGYVLFTPYKAIFSFLWQIIARFVTFLKQKSGYHYKEKKEGT